MKKKIENIKSEYANKLKTLILIAYNGKMLISNMKKNLIAQNTHASEFVTLTLKSLIL